MRVAVKRCERCAWDKEALILQIHHKDRNSRNNERSNLELLCPNCHEMEHFAQKDGRWRLHKKKRRKAPPVIFVDLTQK